MQHISIRNFGKIKDADVFLNGLTLIAGPNDTGKSTVGKLLFSIVQSIANYKQCYNSLKMDFVSKEFLDPMKYEMRVGSRLDEIHYVNRNRSGRLYSKNDDYDDILKRLSIAVSLGRDTNDPMKVLKELKTLQEQSCKSKLFEGKRIYTLLRAAIHFLRQKTTDKNQFETVFARICDDVFHDNLNNSYHRNDRAYIDYKINEESVLKVSLIEDRIVCNSIKNNFAFSGATFIDSADSLEERVVSRPIGFSDRLSDLDFSIKIDLKKKKDVAARRFRQENFYTEITNFIQTILGKASFKYDEDERVIKYKVRRTAKSLDILNIASGSKIFGLLYILLKSGILQKDELLIFDEPENHLHPSWQIMFAELLVKMVKDGFNILLTSHSPYFIQAIKVYSEKYNILDNKVNFYAARKIDNMNYAKLVNIRDPFGNLRDELIFEGLYEPFRTMEKVRKSILRK